MANKFAICIPDFEKMVIWCQHRNGSWAPPFPMSDDTRGKQKADLVKESAFAKA